MCGIFGLITKQSNDNKMQELVHSKNTKILEHMKHRGSDSDGMFSDPKCYLLCSRLNMCDTDMDISLPFCCGDIVVVYDGVIFNYNELREQLINEGKYFRTMSEVEVIVKCYETYGSEFVERLIGQFSICIYDLKRREVYIYRDRLGVKPLFYYESVNYFIFSSSINAIRECFENNLSIRQASISSYLSFNNVIDENTFHDGIKKLAPSSYVLIHKNIATKFNYWNLSQDNVNTSPDIYDSINRLDEKLLTVIKRNLPNEDNINIFLSGGLDSSTIVAYINKLFDIDSSLTKKIHTYSIGFDSDNEFPYASLVADKFQTEHENIITNADDYIESMIDLISFKGEPLNVPNEPLIYIMAQKTKTNGNIILSGEGMNDLLHGYGKLFISYYNYLNDPSEPFYRYFIEKYNSLPSEYKKNLFQKTQQEMLTKFEEDDAKLFEQCFAKCDDLHYQDKIGYIMLKLHLPGILAQLDNATMLASVESRVPFLDHDFVEHCFYRIYREHKIMLLKAIPTFELMEKSPAEISEKFDSPKYILKQLMTKILPIDVIDRKKVNFTVPIEKILMEKYEIIVQLLTSGSINNLKLFDLSGIKEKFINSSRDDISSSNKCNATDIQALWFILNLEIFSQIFVDNKQISDVKTFFHVDPQYKYEKSKLLDNIVIPFDIQLQRYIKLYIIKSLFEKFNIEYFAYGGTMLGCVRHKGFIPWDDNIDLMIMDEQCPKITGDFLMELLYAGFQIKKSPEGYKIIDFVDEGSNFSVDVFIAQYIDDNKTQINFCSPYCLEHFPNRVINTEDLYPLIEYQFGFFTLCGIKDPINYFDNCKFGNYMNCALISKLHMTSRNDVLQAFLTKYNVKHLIVRDMARVSHRDNVVYTEDWKQFFNRTKENIPIDFNTKNYQLLNADLSEYNNIDLYIHYIMHGRFEKRLYSFDAILPPDFDINGYKCLNPDLSKLSDHMLRVHYVTTGRHTNRKYNIRSLLPYDFDSNRYKYLNKDLDKLSEEELIYHYIHQGCKEKRYYSYDGILPTDFSYIGYVKCNRDIKLHNEREAIIHYINTGRKESRKYKL